MAWETRGNNRYYYRKKRKAGKVVSEYVGSGLAAQEIALMDLEERKERYNRNMIMRQQKEEFGVLDQQVTQLSLLVRGAIEIFFIVSGFHKHKGQWRRRRDVNNQRQG